MSKRLSAKSHLLIDEEPLQVLPSLAVALGGLDQAIVLQQMHYWLSRSHHERDGRKWFYNTYEQWQVQFPFWSISTIRRAIYALEQKQVILTTNYNNSRSDKTKWYSINYDKINELCRTSTAQDEQSTAQDEQSTAQDEQLDCSRWAVRSIDARAFPETTTETTNREKDNSLPLVENTRANENVPVKAAKAPKPKIPSSRKCPDDFIVTPAMQAWAEQEYPALDLSYQTAMFRDHEFARAYSDWPATWRNWIRRAATMPQPSPARGHPVSPVPALDTRVSVKGQRTILASQRLLQEMETHGTLGLPPFLTGPERDG